MLHYYFQRHPRKCAIVARARIHEQLSPTAPAPAPVSVSAPVSSPICNNPNTDDIQNDWTEDESWVKDGEAHYFNQPLSLRNEHEFLESAKYIKQKLTQIAHTPKIDEKTELATQIYQYLLENPAILSDCPKFRTITYKKIYELEDTIRKQEEAFASTAILESLQVFDQDIHGAIHPCALLDRIELKLKDIRSLLLQYEAFLSRTELRKTFHLLKPILKKSRSEKA